MYTCILDLLLMLQCKCSFKNIFVCLKDIFFCLTDIFLTVVFITGEVSSVMSLYGDFFNNATDTKMDFIKLSRESRKSGVFTLLAFKETGRLQFISSFLEFLSYTRSLVGTS